MQIVRQASLTAKPWKNGGGITREVIRVPAGDGPFRWRVSIAQIDAPGPFSNFAGYRRTMVLLRGGGVRLDVGTAEPQSLSAVGAMAQFDGAREAHAELLNGACTDLNLMVAESVPHAATVVMLRGPRPVPSRQRDTTLILGITSGLTIECPGSPLEHLEPWDLAVLPPGVAALVAPDGGAHPDSAASSLVFFATVDDNSPEGLLR
jgi:environmental stress-induced protein Ves